MTTNAYSNDTTATVAAGGIQYKKSPDISMDEEVLKISLDKIDISYRFFNHSNHVINETIAFPLPRVKNWTGFPSWDEDYIAHKFISDNPIDKDSQHMINSDSIYNSNLKTWIENAPFINFTRMVNNETYGYHYRIQAFDPSGNDITATLYKNNIPLSVPYLMGYEEAGELEHNQALKEKLKTLQLLDKKNNPIWTTQTTYFWNQQFAPNKEIISGHSYKPGTGYLWLSQTNKNSNPKSLNNLSISGGIQETNLNNYCPTKTDEATILRYLQGSGESKTLRVYEIQYILTTGANWNGPIKKFRLEITPPKSDMPVLFCWPGKLEKTKDGKIVSNIENFIPKNDLKILFVTDHF
jgi:hypothetical protein